MREKKMKEETMRVGKFYVYMQNEEQYLKTSKALWTMKFVPFRVEYLFIENRFEFVGYSPRFDEVPLGEITPTYKIIINDLGGEFHVSVKRL